MKSRPMLVAIFMNTVLAMKMGVNRDSSPGLLGGLIPVDEPTTQVYITATRSTPVTGAQSANSEDDGILGPGGLLGGASTSVKPTSSHSIAATTTPISTATASISASNPTVSTSVTATNPALPGTTSAAPNDLAGNSSDSGDSKTWKVVGVAVICVVAVAIILVGVIFWDRGTRFLGEILCGRSRSDGVENWVPDWEKRSWEVKLPPGEDEGSHSQKYPIGGSSSSDALAGAPQQMYVNEEDGRRYPFTRRPSNPGPVPVFADFVSPSAQGPSPQEHRYSYSLMTTAELQRQNSCAAQKAYTAYT